MNSGPRIYNLFPTLAGSVDAWCEHVPRIAAMRFDWIYVNPFHETGESGSLYAVKSYERLNPLFRGAAALSDDATIRGFIDCARAAGLGIMMDLVINHTARDADLVASHPGWYRHDARGDILSPSASDPADPANVTVWTDLAELDFDDRPERGAMIAHFSAVIRHYLALGVRGFRCDAAYKVPADVWSVLIAGARAEAADVVFAAENLGAQVEEVDALRPAGFDVLFNSSKWWDFKSEWLLDQYDRFRHIAPSIAFPESHDTPRLRADLSPMSAEQIEANYRFRYLFAAFFSAGIMMPMGFEYGFAERLDVVMTRPHHWEQPFFDLSPFIASVNALKAATPALNEEGPQQAMLRDGVAIALVRRSDSGPGSVVAVFNADGTRSLTIDEPDARRIAGSRMLVDVSPGAVAVPLRALTLGPLEMRVFATPPDRDAPPERPPPVTDVRAAARPCVVEDVTPQVDAGRHAVKRIAGDVFVVEATIFREGHDVIAAALRYRKRGAGAWRETPMHALGNDRWSGAFVLDTIGPYEYAVEAWPDAYATWTHDAGVKYAAGQAVSLELIEGRALVAQACARAGKAGRVGFQAVLALFDEAPTAETKLAVLSSAETERLMDLTPDRSQATRSVPVLPLYADRPAAQIGAWYEFFPRSAAPLPGRPGTLADAELTLPRVRDLGFDVVYLPPVHPIGESFRKGRNNTLQPAPGDPGSPWAIGNANGGHRSIEPGLGTLEDFDRFVSRAHENDLEIALDFALQCSPDHPYVREHPEWFAFRPDGTIKYAENPPKKYQDIVNFNWYGPHAPALWNELRDVVEFWIGHGVRIFRVDNPHTKPFAFWEWMIADVQSRHPDVLFLAEAFTRPHVMQELAKVGFSQSYTYFTWRNSKAELTEYLTELAAPPLADVYRPNFFANTPDILPPFLQTGGRPAFLIRLYLAATLSSLYGIYSGFEVAEAAALPGREEYADSEKYEIKHRDWNAPGNIGDHIRHVNRIRRRHRALHDWRNIRFLQTDSESVLCFMKSRGPDTVIVAINLDPSRAADVRLQLPVDDLGYRPGFAIPCENLVSGERFTWRGPDVSVWLDPYVNPALIVSVDRRLPAAIEIAG